jgi:hypothetical protein
MNRASIFDVPAVPRLQTLLEDVRNGRMLIPRFQRPFIWKDEQRLLLLDSISKGMPIGSLLVWRTKDHDLETYPKLGPFRLNQPEEKQPWRTYLLDGHQRLSTLYGALSGELTDTDPEDRTSWPIYYVLEKDMDDLRFKVHRRQGLEPPITWLPLSSLFDPIALFDYQKKLMEKGMKEEAREAEGLANRLKDYQIPIIPIITEDLSLVTDSFQRINREGTRMSEAHMLSALIYTKEFDLSRKLKAISERIAGNGWNNIDPQVLLSCLKAANDLDVYRAGPKEVKEIILKNNNILDEIAEHVSEAIKFLSEDCHVKGTDVLPFSYQLVGLSEAVRVNGGPLQDSVGEAIRKWFWVTTYSEHFTGASGSAIMRAIEHIRRIVRSRSRPLRMPGRRVRLIAVIQPGMSRKVTPRTKFDFTSARGRAFALMLARCKPLNAMGGDIGADHLLADLGRKALQKICPEERADRLENRLVARSAEARLLREVICGVAGPLKEKVLRSHAIPEEAAASLAGGDTQAFFDIRRKHLLEMEQTFVEDIGLEWDLSNEE